MPAQIAIAYSTRNKTYAIVSKELGQAMLSMGNPHGFNRMTLAPKRDEKHIPVIMKLNGYALAK